MPRLVAGVSRRLARRWLREGLVLLDGVPLRHAARLREGQRLRFPAPHPGAPRPSAQPELALPILYQDDDLLAVDKPAGMPSTARSPFDTGTVANFLLALAPPGQPPPGPPGDGGLLHRLDNDTSGVLVAARRADTFAALLREFRAGLATKEYLALVEGRLTAARHASQALGHDRRDPRRMRIARRQGRVRGRARPASTRIEPVASTGARTLVRIVLSRGARHQVRVHLAALGHPIVGDRLYGRADEGGRLMLHAWRVRFRHPRTMEALCLTAPPPAELLPPAEMAALPGG